jgi:hypothetical protein
MLPFRACAHRQALSVMSSICSKSVASNGRMSERSQFTFATAASAASFRPERIRFAPRAESAPAMAAPMPDEAPVIHHTLA